MRARHFRPAGARRFELSRQIREAVTFAPLNLATDAFPGSLDLIVCRNVLMYFTDAARERTVGQLRAVLAPGGELVLSPLDALPEAEVATPHAEPAPPPPSAPRVDTLAKARAEADRGRLEAARALCLETLRERPLDADAHLLLAAVEEERGDLDAAIWALRRAIYTAPDGPAAHFRLGGLLLRSGAPDAGRNSLATAAALLASAPPDALVDGLTAGEVLAAVKAAS
jgi:chemotaxis protein methyltransferase CheR